MSNVLVTNADNASHCLGPSIKSDLMWCSKFVMPIMLAKPNAHDDPGNHTTGPSCIAYLSLALRTKCAGSFVLGNLVGGNNPGGGNNSYCTVHNFCDSTYSGQLESKQL